MLALRGLEFTFWGFRVWGWGVRDWGLRSRDSVSRVSGLRGKGCTVSDSAEGEGGQHALRCSGFTEKMSFGSKIKGFRVKDRGCRI